MGAPIDISTIVSGLTGRIEALVADLLPAGRREGVEWRVGSLAGEPGRSMAVHLRGNRAGVWKDFAGGEAGDALDLVAQVLFAGDKKQAVKWSLTWLGLDDTAAEGLSERRRELDKAARRRAREAAAEAERRSKGALRLWLSARESLRGTPAALYLAGRGLALERLGRQPRALRYHPELMNTESGRAWPALVALIVDAQGRPAAVHRTWLAPDGAGGWRKAPLQDAKMTLGPYAGGAVRIWRGVDAAGRRAPPLEAAPAGSAVTVTEGIEDALTVALADPSRRVLAAVSLANMGAMKLPAAIATVTIVADNDPPGSPAERALARAIGHFQAGGRRVLVARAGGGCKDVNERLTRSGGSAA